MAAGKSEVVVWPVAENGSAMSWKGHSSYVRAVAFSPDERLLATIGSDGLLLLRDGKTGLLRKTFPRVSDTELWALAWSPDGKQWAVGTDHWDVLVYSTSGAEPEKHSAFGSSVQSLAWSPDGTLLAVGDLNGVVALWSTKTWETVRQMTVESNRISINTFGLAWSPNGERLASAHDDGVVRLWRKGSDTAVRQFHAGSSTRCVAWSPDGKKIASGTNRGVLAVWDVQTGKLDLTRSEGTEPILSVAWSPDGKSLAAGSGVEQMGRGGQVRLWQVGE